MKDLYVSAINEADNNSPAGMLKLVFSLDRIDAYSKKSGRLLVIAQVSERQRQYVKQWGIVSPFKKRDVRFVDNKEQAIEVIRRMAGPYLVWEQARAS